MRFTLQRPLRPPDLVVNAGLAVLAVAGAAWSYQLVTGPATAAAASTDRTRTVAVSQGDVTRTVSATGSVESAVTATADFTTTGTVTAIDVAVGDAVTKGQRLARVDGTEARARLDAARANLSAARASLDRAEDSGDEASIAAAEAQVTSAEATATEAERSLAGTVLTAPMAGTVTAVNGRIGGSSAGSASAGFVELADLGRMRVSASFAEADATRLAVGQTATVTWAALAGASTTGAVATIAPTATTDDNVNSYDTVVRLDERPAGIRIGQTVTVVVTVAEATNVVRVPAAAVRSVANGHVVTVAADGAPQARPVRVGVEGDTFTEITSGLSVGEQVVIVTSGSNGTTGNGPVFPGGNVVGPGGGGGPVVRGGPAGGGP